jgi:hypothetical protein
MKTYPSALFFFFFFKFYYFSFLMTVHEAKGRPVFLTYQTPYQSSHIVTRIVAIAIRGCVVWCAVRMRIALGTPTLKRIA